VWNEWLTPPSSGTAGNLIKFDAYGNGRPPEFTGRYTTTSSQWTNTSGNVWQIPLTATQAVSQLKFVQFGSLWGNSQTAQAALAHNRDWYYDSVNQILYVYSSGGNPVAAYGSVTPIILSGQSLININSVSYVENRLNALERADVRRSVYDRLVNAALTTAISALIASHDKWWK